MDMMTLDQQANLRALADELDSGKHQQGFSALRMTDEVGNVHMCCLGVGCMLIRDEWEVERVTSYGDISFANEDVSPHVDRDSEVIATGYFWDDSSEAAELPDEARRHYGLNAIGSWWTSPHADLSAMPEAMRKSYEGGMTALATMNDEFATFADIAATIRFILDNPDVVRFYDASITIPRGVIPDMPEVATGA